jgi:hypothetical protein
VPEDLGAELVESTIDRLEAPVNRLEAPVDRVEPLIDGRKALAEESDELRMLGRGHARPLPHSAGAFKCVNS